MLDSARLVVRALLRNRAFSLTATASVALGVALAATVGAVANAYLLRSLPFADAERIHHVSYGEPRNLEPRGVSAIDWRSLANVVEVADSTGQVRLHLRGAPWLQEIIALRTQPSSVHGIGFRVIAGRPFSAADFEPGAQPAMLINRALWADRYRSDSSIIGRFVPVAPAGGAATATSVQIIGVLADPVRVAQGYERGEVDAVLPLRGNATVFLVRLRAGATPAAAERAIEVELRKVATAIPDGWRGVRLESMKDRYTAPVRPVLIGIAAAVGLVLLIVLANVAVLALLRRLRREKELAVRSALGASRGRIIQLALGEGVAIAGTGALIGSIASIASLTVLTPIIEARLGRAPAGGTGAIGIDSTVLAIVLAVIALALVALVLPGLLRRESDLIAALRRSGLGAADGPQARRARSLLVGAEVAVSVVLLTGTGLMIGSVRHLVGTDLGVDALGVVRTRLSVPARSYPTDSAKSRFYSTLAATIAPTQDNRFALTSGTPLYEPAHLPVERDSEDSPNGVRPAVISVSGDYFTTVGIRVTKGRNFDRRDAWGSEPTAMVSEALSQKLWPGVDPIGQRIRTRSANPAADTSAGAWRTVVGVVGNVRQGFGDANLMDLYLPFSQVPTQYAQFMARGARADSAVAEVRHAATTLDPDAMVANISRFENEIRDALAGPRFIMSLLGVFAAAAVLIAVVGLYGVTAYAVEQRQRELAVRLALGATVGAVVRLFVTQGGRVVLAGVLSGALGAAAAGRILASQLHGVRAFELVPTLGGVAVMIIAAGIAIWWPARRVAAVNPATTLKEG
jgi:putative ABC transport system permease protein